MNAIQFIKDHGVEKAREVVDSIPSTRVNFYVLDDDSFLELPDHLDPYPHLNANYKVYVLVSDLKRLVESVDMVEERGGIGRCKLMHFNSPFKRDNNIKRLKQTIADYEAIGGEHV